MKRTISKKSCIKEMLIFKKISSKKDNELKTKAVKITDVKIFAERGEYLKTRVSFVKNRKYIA